MSRGTDPIDIMAAAPTPALEFGSLPAARRLAGSALLLTDHPVGSGTAEASGWPMRLKAGERPLFLGMMIDTVRSVSRRVRDGFPLDRRADLVKLGSMRHIRSIRWRPGRRNPRDGAGTARQGPIRAQYGR